MWKWLFKDRLIVPRHRYTQREKTVVNVLKKNYELEIKSFLNVGFHDWDDERRHWWIKVCDRNNIDWRILEIFKPNVENAIQAGCPKERISVGNILDFSTYGESDCIFFWHGPEHIDKDVFLKSLSEIENRAKKIIIFGMPHGEEIQDAVYGNKYEEHVSAWDESEWQQLGYKTIVVNDRNPGHITAYKIK